MTIQVGSMCKMGRDVVEVLEARPRGSWLVAGKFYEGTVAEGQLVELTEDELAQLDEEEAEELDELAGEDAEELEPEGDPDDDASRETVRIEPDDDPGDPPEDFEEDRQKLLGELREAMRAMKAQTTEMVELLRTHVDTLSQYEREILRELDVPELPPPGPLVAVRRAAVAKPPAVTSGARAARRNVAPAGAATTGKAGQASTRAVGRASTATVSEPSRRREPLPPVTNGRRGVTNGQRPRGPAKATVAPPVPRQDDPVPDDVATAAAPIRRRR